MGLLDRLLGRKEPARGRDPRAGSYPGQDMGQDVGGRPAPGSDEAAIERYRYLLRTAPPETIEEAHAEAFARLTPEQRRQVLAQLSSEVPAAEHPGSDDPRTLARMATRAEMRNPGTLERSLGRGPGATGMGMGMGGMIAGSLLASVAGAFVGTAIADAMFDMSDAGAGDGGEDGESGESGEYGETGGDPAAGGDYGGDGGGGFGGGDFGGDFGGGEF